MVQVLLVQMLSISVPHYFVIVVGYILMHLAGVEHDFDRLWSEHIHQSFDYNKELVSIFSVLYDLLPLLILPVFELSTALVDNILIDFWVIQEFLKE